jgi:hypothetical protein
MAGQKGNEAILNPIRHRDGKISMSEFSLAIDNKVVKTTKSLLTSKARRQRGNDATLLCEAGLCHYPCFIRLVLLAGQDQQSQLS